MSDRNLPSNDTVEPLAGLSEKPTMMPASVGAELAAHRQAKGWTVEQVASSLKLAPRQIEAIETDNHSMLPGIAVTRGFVRAYAKLLRIDAIPLLASMRSATDAALPGNRVVAAPFSDVKRSSFGKKRSNGKLVFGLLLLGGAAVAVLGFQQISSMLPSISQFVPKQRAETPEATDESDVTKSAASSSPTIAVTVVSNDSRTDSTIGGAAAAGNDAPPAVLQTDINTAAPSEEPSDIAAKTNNLLQITMKQDSWLEVRRVTGNDVLAARLAKAGTVETFEVDSPIKLTIGNVAGVEAIFRGEPVQLTTAAGGNVARMTIE